MADPPIVDVTTRPDGGAAWRVCVGGICVIAPTIIRAQTCAEALCRSAGIKPPAEIRPEPPDRH
jgi:hypothetical protein